MRGKPLLVWIVLAWALVTACFVTDLFVCPWTAVFDAPAIGSKEKP
jgi:hypothetical protein